jgi:hypothetical protein
LTFGAQHKKTQISVLAALAVQMLFTVVLISFEQEYKCINLKKNKILSICYGIATTFCLHLFLFTGLETLDMPVRKKTWPADSRPDCSSLTNQSCR